jgi:serine phosphatase RsbU (regulator of sigma subunit)
VRALAHAVALAAIYGLSRWDYLLFHTLIETLSVLVAVGIFVIAWNTRSISENRYLSTLSTGLLFVGMTSLLHMFTIKGMGVIPSASVTANIATQLWIVSRLFMGFAFLAAGSSLKHHVPFKPTLAAFAIVWLGAIASVLVFKNFPTMFVEGEGLTPLKIALEYVAIAMYCLGGGLLWLRRAALERSTANRLLVAIGLMVAAELSFTLYTDVYGVLNALGHLFVLGSSILIYFALIETTLTRPYESLFRELHRREQEEARIAGVLQTALACTPQRVQGVEVASTYRSATTGALIGGDFLDVWSPEADIVAFVVGDVCGKGIDAAVTNATVRTTLRSYAHEDWRPETVLRRTNEALHSQLPSDKFVTMCYGVIDVRTGHVSLVNAGHPDPVLRRTDGRAEVLEARRHPPLGVVDDDPIEVLHAQMEPCDVLVIMTDGVVEAGWKRGAFGIEGAVRALEVTQETTSDSIAQALEDAAVLHAGAQLTDDVSILAMRYEPAACDVEWAGAEGAA